MFSPWQMQQVRPTRAMPMVMVPMQRAPLMEVPAGGFPVPQSISPEEFPSHVRAAILRVIEGPPKPAVTLKIMNETQASMIAPDLPNRADV